MTNIFNKTVLAKNGTLIGNWFEEDVMREKTGEGRTLPGKHVPKKSMNFDTQVDNAYKKDDTFSRTMGQKLETPFCTFNETYGKFSEAENKYKKTGIKEKIFEDFFKAYVNNEQAEKSKLDESIKNIRLYDSTTKNLNVSQPADFGSLGSRHMITQDNIPVNKEKIDKLFMANHEMSKYPNILSDAQAGGYVDKYIPYYKDKEITYWSMNLDKGNMWRSHTLGENAFARSSGFTQPIHNSKAVNQYLGNVTNSSSSKNIYLGQKDFEFIDKYNMSNLQNSTPTDLLPQITEKIMNACKSKGWLGLRNLRIFLYGCVKRCTDFIDKSNFKYFFTNFGIVFLEKEVEFIFAKFDHKRNNSINYNEFLDTFTICCDNRTNLIKTFFEQIKNKTNDFASFKKLEKIGNFDNHPEVLYSNKTSPNVKYEYSISWDNLKLDDLISQDNLLKFFIDVSSCIDSHELFLGCLKSCGML